MKDYGLTSRQRQIVTLASLGTLTQREIAVRVGCHYNSVYRVLKSPAAQAMLADIQGAVQHKVVTNLAQDIDKTAAEAVAKLKDHMRNSPPAVSYRATESLLDRASASVVPKRLIHSQKNVEGRITHLHLDASELRRLYDVLIEDSGGDQALIDQLPDKPESIDCLVKIDSKGEIVPD